MAAPADEQYHVLAVDDSLLDRKLIERLLKISSCHVTTVDSGNKALEYLGLQDGQGTKTPPCVSPYQQEIQVNLIITDYCMPQMTGYDLLKRLKESESLKDIPVVIMSSENIPSRITRCLEEGAEDFFLKPMKLSDVKKLKSRLLSGKASSKENMTLAKQQTPEGQLVPSLQQYCQPLGNIIHTSKEITAPRGTNSNKRKSMEGHLSPDRKRPNYKEYGLTAVV